MNKLDLNNEKNEEIDVELEDFDFDVLELDNVDVLGTTAISSGSSSCGSNSTCGSSSCSSCSSCCA